MLKPHSRLEEAVLARHVVWISDREVLNQYWEWCRLHSRAFAAIAIATQRSRFALVEMDLYGLGAGGLDRSAGYEILQILLEQTLKLDSTFVVGPVYVSATVLASSAAAFAGRICRSAQGALSLDQITHEEWMEGEIERFEAGGSKKSAFAPISGQARPEVIKELLKDGWHGKKR
ncbi:MAG: hypothetical protein PHF94_06030 [Methanothrix sp.]|nr:hypothetical protein [Methanothrix sp.]